MISAYSTLAVSCLFDGILLWVTGRLLPRRLHTDLWIAAMAVAQLPTLWVLVSGEIYAVAWAVALTWPVIVVRVALGSVRRGQWMRGVTIFYGVTMVAGGTATLLASLASAMGLPPGILSLGGASVVLVAIGWMGPRWRRRWLATSVSLTELEICFDGAKVRVAALWDSGNQLTDPVSGRQVLIVELRAVWSALPGEILPWAIDACQGNLVAPPERWLSRLGTVAFHSLGGRGQIPFIRPDAVLGWDVEGGWMALSPVMVGLTGGPLSQDGRYQALISPACRRSGEQEGVIGA